MCRVPDTQGDELVPFVENLAQVPKSGLHNPLLNPERYLLYGDICARLTAEMRKPEVETYFTRLIQRVVPKSEAQCRGEVVVTRKFIENFVGDNVRFLARSFGTPGDHVGQFTQGHRFPYGGVAVICPFNFPLEIPALQVIMTLRYWYEADSIRYRLSSSPFPLPCSSYPTPSYSIIRVSWSRFNTPSM